MGERGRAEEEHQSSSRAGQQSAPFILSAFLKTSNVLAPVEVLPLSGGTTTKSEGGETEAARRASERTSQLDSRYAARATPFPNIFLSSSAHRIGT